MPVAAAAPEQEVVFSQTETATDRRYVASNRFEIVPRSAAKFEARWATRKSRLAVLDGFRYFSLLRLTSAEGDGEMAKFNYVSFTIWSDKKGFNSWRTGEAFKEAHGGGTIFGFMDMLVNSIGVLKGPPKPVFYEGMFSDARAPDASQMPKVEGGWRVVEANGQDKIDSEIVASMTNFQVDASRAKDFEALFSDFSSSTSGFITFLLMKRDTQTKMHGSEDPSSLPAGSTYTAVVICEKDANIDAVVDTLPSVDSTLLMKETEKARYEGILCLENPTLGA